MNNFKWVIFKIWFTFLESIYAAPNELTENETPIIISLKQK